MRLRTWRRHVGTAALVVLGILAGPGRAAAWGFEAHRLINGKATETLPEPLRALFEELSMSLVLQSIHDDALALPEPMTPLARGGQGAESHRRVLRAHEVLASLSEQNREEFRAVIENLRSELDDSSRGSGSDGRP